MKDKIIGFLKGRGIGGEAVRYIVIGVMTTLVNFSLFALMTKALKIDVTISNVTSVSVSILFAYITNKLIVFRRRSSSRAELMKEFFKFVGSRLFTMALEIGSVLLFVNVFGQDELVGKVEAQVLVIIANYIISKVFVFR